MNWNNLQTMQCPSCKGRLQEDRIGYVCECEFYITYERFQTLINKMMMPKKKLYDPDTVDRSDWV